LVDLADPGCYGPFDNNERDISGPQCDNGLDDDSNGLFDYPNDPSCTGPTDATECGACARSGKDGDTSCCARESGPAAPKNLIASDGTSIDYVELTWDGVAEADSYVVLRSEYPDGLGEIVGETTGTRYEDRSAVPGVDYYYAVLSVNHEGSSGRCSTDWGYRLDLSSRSDSDGDGVSDEQEQKDGTDIQDRGAFKLHLSNRVFTKYSTFVGQWNFLELISGGDVAINALVTVFLPTGEELASSQIYIPTEAQVDVDINTMVARGCEAVAACAEYVDLDGNGLIDLYGVVQVEFANQPGAKLSGRMSSYRANSDGTFSFAFSRELRNPTRGKTYATGNTYDPQGAGNLVPNWLEIINVSSEVQTFTYRLFNQEGANVYERVVSIDPLGEVDMQAGHEITDASGKVLEGVYLAEVSPHDGAAEYLVAVTRYSSNAPAGVTSDTYNFAFALEGRAGSGTPQYMPINNQVGACYSQTNWVEVVNTREIPVTATLVFRGTDGIVRAAPTDLQLAAKSQYHFNAGALLDSGDVGSVSVLSSDQGALITQSLVYYHDCAENKVQTAYVSLGRLAGAAKQAGSINTFLGMKDELRVITTASQQIEVAAELRTFDSISSPVSDVLTLQSLGTTFVESGSSVMSVTEDRYGALTLTTKEQGSFVAEVLRVRELPDGRVDFAIPTAVQ
jgi:hypothetical protein